MKKPTLLLGMLFAAVASLGLSGCGPVAPANPGYAADIRPLLVARCIRCHDQTKRLDPALEGSKAAPNSNFNYPTLADFPPAPSIDMTFLKASPTYVSGKASTRRMPPPPAEALEDWQIEMLTTWASMATPVP